MTIVNKDENGISSGKILWLDKINQFYQMPNTVEEYNFEQEAMKKQMELDKMMKDCIRVGNETLTIDNDHDVTISLGIFNGLKNERKFRQFKRDVSGVLNNFFDGDYSKRVFNMLDEQINRETKRVVNLQYSNHYIKDKKLVLVYTVYTRSEVFNNVMQLPLPAEKFEVCDE